MLDDIKKTLWATADKLRVNLDAADYKHLVLGLIFVKYISDTFLAKQIELKQRLRDSKDEYYFGEASDAELAKELELRDYYTATNVFWVPESARWEALRAAAKSPDIGKRIDDALTFIETENPKLKGILDKRYARAQLPDGKLGELVDLISTIGFGDNPSTARDILGQVYEYFLGMFANAEGKRGGQFYTPASIVKTLVAVLSPHSGKVYDPCCGSGGMFVQSEKFIEAHGGKLGDVSIYGQEANPTTWRLAAMNLAIRGIDFNLGRDPEDTFVKNQHPDLRADYIMANPPFNISDWWHASLTGDHRWVFGTPPESNANYAWLQHMLQHLKPTGVAGIVLANGSLSTNQSAELAIRKNMVDSGLIDAIIWLPSQLFLNTPIAACIWIIRKDAATRPEIRQRELLMIDARKLGHMETRTHRIFTDEDVDKISNCYNAWISSVPSAFKAEAGYSKSVTLNQIKAQNYALVPGRYVGFSDLDRPSLDKSTLIKDLEAVNSTLEDFKQKSMSAVERLRSLING